MGVVATHVVAGTSFITEFFASFSDVLGGRSGSYERQLANLYARAQIDLLREAEARGANWVVGFRADIDQLSGKNTQMLMITAIGTAVLAELVLDGPVPPPRARGRASAEDVAVMRRKLHLRNVLRRAEDESITISEEAWTFLADQRASDLAGQVAQLLLTSPTSCRAEIDPTLFKSALRYFRALEPDQSVEALYDALAKPASRANHDGLIELICELRLVDYQRIGEALARGGSDQRRNALQTLHHDQATYAPDDLRRVAELKDLVQTAFDETISIRETKGLLGSRKEWTCSACRGQVAEQHLRCGCGADRRGFGRSDFTPEQAAEFLQQQEQVLMAVFAA
jgi:uncharacterized protein YbjQ (UPF0145 family)